MSLFKRKSDGSSLSEIPLASLSKNKELLKGLRGFVKMPFYYFHAVIGTDWMAKLN